MSPLRGQIESLRDLLNWALNDTLRPTPEEELAEASDILRRYVKSGYIEGYDCDNGHLVWHPMAMDEKSA
jgi:hypothetical protein